MKLYAFALLFAVGTANAQNLGSPGNSGNAPPFQGGTSNASATAVGVGTGVGVGIGGSGGAVGDVSGVGTGGSANFNNRSDFSDLRIVPPAIAPAVTNFQICPMVMQGSKAGSVFFFSGSGTHKPDIIEVCVAYQLGQLDVVERLTCNASKEYRKANPNCEQVD